MTQLSPCYVCRMSHANKISLAHKRDGGVDYISMAAAAAQKDLFLIHKTCQMKLASHTLLNFELCILEWVN